MRELLANSSRARLVVVLLGASLALPALAAPLALDDLFHFASLEGRAPAPLGWWEMFTFFPADEGRRRLLIESGAASWWTSPDLHLAFFRPLSSALVVLDHALFGRSAVGRHIHSLLWWVALLLAAAAFYRRVLPERTALLALALFAIDDSHWMPITWAAARNGLVAALPGLLGLMAHLRWRQRGWRPGAWLAPFFFSIALAGGEPALGVLAYVVAFEVVGEAGKPWKGRLLALLPYGILMGVYALLRRLTGAGVSHSGSYVDPTTDPVRFMLLAVVRVPALLAAEVFGTPVELLGVGAWGPPLLVGLGLGALLFVVSLLKPALAARPPDEERAALWLGAGAVLAVVPGVGAMLGDRVLIASSIGAAAVLALVLQHAIRRWRELKGQGFRRALAAAAVLAVALPNVVLSAPLLVGKMVLWKTLAEKQRDQVCEAAMPGPGPTRALVVWTDQPPLAGFGGAAKLFYCPGTTVSWSVLSMSPHPQTLTRTSPRELTLKALDKPLLDSEWEILFRDPS